MSDLLIKLFENTVNKEFEESIKYSLPRYFMFKTNIPGSRTEITNPIDKSLTECDLRKYYTSEWVYDKAELSGESAQTLSSTACFSLMQHMNDMIKEILWSTPYTTHLTTPLSEEIMRMLRSQMSMLNFPEDGNRLCLTDLDTIHEIAWVLNIPHNDTFSWNGITFVPVTFKSVKLRESKPVLILTHSKALVACFGDKITSSLSVDNERQAFLLTNEQYQGVDFINPHYAQKVILDTKE